MDRFRIALVQLKSVLGELDTNLSKAEHYIREAASNGAKFIVLPEAFNTGYYCAKIKQMAEMKEPMDGRTMTLISSLARELGVYIVAPFIEDLGNGEAANTSVLVDDTGKVVGKHRKTHPVGDEAVYFKRGNDYSVFETKYGKIGLLVCYDVCFPETARLQALAGAEIICVSIACRDLSFWSDWTQICLAARAVDNVVYVAGCCMAGNDFPDSPFTGKSVVYAPTGQVLAMGTVDDEMVVYQEINLSSLAHERTINTCLTDRHAEDFAPLCR